MEAKYFRADQLWMRRHGLQILVVSGSKLTCCIWTRVKDINIQNAIDAYSKQPLVMFILNSCSRMNPDRPLQKSRHCMPVMKQLIRMAVWFLCHNQMLFRFIEVKVLQDCLCLCIIKIFLLVFKKWLDTGLLVSSCLGSPTWWIRMDISMAVNRHDDVMDRSA